MGVSTVTELKQSVSGKRTFRQSSSTRQVNDWPLTDVSSDLTVEVGSTHFALHKFPLVSRSGKIRKLISDSSRDSKPTRITIQNMPGGPESFELAAKFCYGLNIDLTIANVATLRCAAHHLQMTEEISDRNLESQSESYLKETVFTSITNSISVLHRCQSLLPVAEDIGLLTRIVSAIVSNVCKEQLTSGLSKLGHNKTTLVVKPHDWEKSIGILGLEFFQRVVSSLRTKGCKQETVCRILMNYAERNIADNVETKKQRAIVEAIVGLLPTQSRRSRMPMGFLSGLLKTSVAVSASAMCRGDLERRIAMQLDRAILEDLLIPAAVPNGSGSSSHLYDIDSASRIFSTFLNLNEDDEDDDEERDGCYEFGSPRSPKQSTMLKVSKLLDSYLVEIALDSNLTASKFIAIVELLPDHARAVNDGLYRAVDIFLKVHPNIKESERYRLCKTIDCQKLSQEACSHAAQNERLPVQMAVQVLYFEQIRLRNAMNGNQDQIFFGSIHGQYPQRSGSGVGSGAISPRDNYASVRRENRELKLEVARMRMRLTDLEKDHVSIRQELVKANPANKLLKSFTKKLSKLNSLFRMRDVKPMNPKAVSDARFLFQRRRRHSIS
ncbi:uncharacterized protein A4U43_C07F15300 [Asparagus officinalis]|uniref:NPH3 domain-containing protein n=1 Tax=Asparagus officinalis TaxID=4686 RepID=A0A5P1EC78_ASPOF|nr:BTB/POZ domain-containing protein At1g03010 [Asparagus officinalis]ONK63452.1 uncharacterized protein A4U43_C07F15300 [Asparagus officinalis]